jgi:transposase
MATKCESLSIPTKLSLEEFNEFVLPHLPTGCRGPPPKLSLHLMFNYILKLLYIGCQWKELPIDVNADGKREIHYSRIYRMFRYWSTHGCIDAILVGTVMKLKEANLLDTSVLHGDGTTTAAKKGGDNLAYSGHKRLKGDKIVAFCDRNCNVLAPFVAAAGNQNESPLFQKALPLLTETTDKTGISLLDSIISLDGVYDCRVNRKAIFNRGMIPNINENKRNRKHSTRGR